MSESNRQERCLNCETNVGLARFCPECGQEQTEPVHSVRELLGHFFDDVLSLDSRVVRTLKALVTRPGFLTNEYIRGRQVSYVRPLRLYLAMSLLYFLLFAWFNDEGFVRNVRTTGSSAASDSTQVETPVVADDDSGVLEAIGKVPIVGSRLLERSRRLETMENDELSEVFNDAMSENLPKGVFLLVPAFALVLRGVYVRSKRRYAEHFVFALHVHAFAFLMFIPGIFVPDPVGMVLSLAIVVYVLVSMKRVYKQGFPKTFTKFVGLAVSYLLLLMLAFIGTALVSILTMSV